MSEEKMRAALQMFLDAVTYDDKGYISGTDTWKLDRAVKYAKTALQESEAGAVTAYVMTKHLVDMREYGSAFAHLRSCLGQQVRPNSEYTALYTAPPSAQAIETAAIMKCVEVCDRQIAHWGDRFPGETQAVIFVKDALIALIPQDGRTQLEQMLLEAHASGVNDVFKQKEEFGMAVAQEVAVALVGLSASYQAEKLRAIVTSLIGAAK